METHPLISVIVPAYNAAATIVRTLDSVRDQAYTHWEVIIIDDGSSDATKDIVQSYGHSEKIKYTYQENGGPAAARNTGIRQARGEYIAFLDADDYWHAEKLEMQIAVFAQSPETVVCSTETYCIDPYSDLIWETRRSPWTIPRSGNVVPFLAFHNVVTLSSAMTPKRYLVNAGMFDEDRDIIMTEDLDLWLKLAPLGPFVTISQPLTFYQTRSGITAQQALENHRKIREVFRRNMLRAHGQARFWYTVGYIRSSCLYLLRTMKFINTIKKIGIRGVIKEVARRLYLRVDFFMYPLLWHRLQKGPFDTISQMCDFAYRHSFRLLVPGQIESEIVSFLEIAKNEKPKNVLEIGTAHGGNLFLLAKIAEDGGKVISIDLPNGDYGGGYFARKKSVYQRFAQPHQEMTLIRADSHAASTLDQVQAVLKGESVDVLFIDADHSYEGVRSDFFMYRDLVRPGGIIAFHDIANDMDATYGVNRFWNEIKEGYRHQEFIDDPLRPGYGIGVVYR